VTPRLLVGKLDAESRLAGETLSRAALATASALATLLRAFAREGDRLWTPAPVAPERLPELPGLPRPELLCGDWERLEPVPEVLAWAEVSGVAKLRSPPRTPTSSLSRLPASLPLHELVWRIPRPDPEVVERVLHRGFHLRVARELGVALPGARRIASAEELERHLEGGGAAASPTGGWVVKAPWSAAGRSRVIEPSGASDSPSAPGAVLRPAARRRVERLLDRHGELLFEPWMDRVADFGCTGLVTGEGGEVDAASIRCHRLEVDSDGRFQGIELPATGEDPREDPNGVRGRVKRPAAVPAVARTGIPGLEQVFRVSVDGRHGGQPLQRIALQVAGCLRDAGYRGPFGLDAYLHRDREGREVVHPLGEINARLTFGHVARALEERLAGSVSRRGVRLAVGGAVPARENALVLLRAGEDGSPGAWIETL